MPDHVVPNAILWLPFVASLVVFVLRGRGRNLAAWLMTCAALACLLLTLSLYPGIPGRDALRPVFEWAPSLCISEARRFGKACCGPTSSRWPPTHYKTN